MTASCRNVADQTTSFSRASRFLLQFLLVYGIFTFYFKGKGMKGQKGEPVLYIIALHFMNNEY